MDKAIATVSRRAAGAENCGGEMAVGIVTFQDGLAEVEDVQQQTNRAKMESTIGIR